MKFASDKFEEQRAEMKEIFKLEKKSQKMLKDAFKGISFVICEGVNE